MPDPLYIDQIQFSDATYEIRDTHARELIEQILISGGLPTGTADNDILLWDDSDREWKPKALYTKKDILTCNSANGWIDTGIIPGQYPSIRIETEFKINSIADEVIFLIGENGAFAIDGIDFGIHNGKWNTLISGQDYGDTSTNATTNRTAIIYEVSGNTITVSGDVSATKTISNLSSNRWSYQSVKLGLRGLSALCDYYIFKIYINNDLVFEMEPGINNLTKQIGIINKITKEFIPIPSIHYSLSDIS